jgi:CheY-like chemotaxis protein
MPLADDAGKGIDVLVVEDSRVQAAAVRLSLLQKEFVVRIAENGAEGLAMMKEQRPDVVISDVEMPEMNGYELCAAIKANPRLKDTPVILLTALGDPEDILKGLEVKADINYLTKPWDDELLYARVQQVLALDNARHRYDKVSAQNLSSR